MSDESQEVEPRVPEYDDTPVTMGLIGDIIDAHPDYRAIAHFAENGNRFMMLEFPDEEDEFTDRAPGKFVEFVSKIGEDDGFFEDTETLISERNSAYATLMHTTDIALKFTNESENTAFMWATGNGMDEIVAADDRLDEEPYELPHGMFGDLLINKDVKVIDREDVPVFSDFGSDE